MNIRKNNYKTTDIHKTSYEDSSDIIENDEYFGEIISNKNNLINNNKILYRNKISDKGLQFGDIIEERENYMFYVSGVRYNNISTLNSENKSIYIPINSRIDQINYNSSKIENYQCDKLQKENLDLSNSKKESFHGKNDIFESYNNKSSYNFEDVGIIRDFTSGKLFKIYQAIPFDINNEIIEYDLNKAQKYLNNRYKTSYGNKNNFLINSCDINKNIKRNYIFENNDIQIENKPKLLEKNKFINNNNYIEINECTS